MNALVPELAPADFDTHVLQSPRTVLLEFRTEWCPPCRALAPTLEQLAAQYPDQLRIFTIDIEAFHAFARQFNITAVPTLLIFKQGRQTQRIQGAPAKPILLQALALHTPSSRVP